MRTAAARAGRQQAGIVKSAARVFEVLEHFDEAQRELSVMEIARALDYPQSSTSALLHSLMELGYLSYDQHSRTYRPTARVTLLGSWVIAPFFREGALPRLMADLNRRTGETIILAVQSGFIVRYIQTIQGTNAMRLYVPPGTTRPMANSGIGRLFLSLYDDDELRGVVRRLNADRDRSQPPTDLRQLTRALQRIRETGYSVSANLVTPGAGVVARFLPRVNEERPMAVGIGGHSEVILARQAEFAAMLASAMRTHFGPMAGPRGGSGEARPARGTR